jgi:hypothetical protein
MLRHGNDQITAYAPGDTGGIVHGLNGRVRRAPSRRSRATIHDRRQQVIAPQLASLRWNLSAI